jgi:N,N-dimethylformamidase
MIPLIGYGDRLSARPGETIEFKVSSQGPAPFRADLVRIASADPNPAGPGLRLEPIDAAFAGEYPSRVQVAHLGSYARVDWPAGSSGLRDFTLLATIWPTTPEKGTQGVVSCLDPAGSAGAALAVGEDGGAVGILGQGGAAPLRLAAATAMKERTWYRVWIAYDGAARRLTVGQYPLDATGYGGAPATTEVVLDDPAEPLAPSAVLIAALGGTPVTGVPVTGHYNGKIERPQIFGRALAPEEIEAAARGEVPDGLVACWDFSREIPSTRIVDTGPQGLDGVLVNLPDRAMTGSSWTGREMCWRHAPQDYGAIHFHDDDLYDCAWQTDFSYTLPADLASGVYGARLSCGNHEDTIPFFVCPPRGRRNADLCVVIPTFTYVIYANHARPDFGAHWRERAAAWNGYPWNPADHPDFALSTYNFHSDGSGISHASRLRPILTLRPGFISIAETRGSGLRHFQADMHLLDWLEAKGYDFDIVTDEELHNEGAQVLAGYRTVMTPSHPEYHSKETLDALQAYRDGGGRFVYLGGNGFYWRVALHSEAPGVLEIRRGEGGIRAWAAEPGEYYNSFDGAYGGLWRRGGRPPQKLAGIGFSAQGLFEGSHYRRSEASSDPRVAWIFAGVDDQILGDFGLSGGGAAGLRAGPGRQAPGHPRPRHRGGQLRGAQSGHLRAGARRAPNPHGNLVRGGTGGSDPRRHGVLRDPGRRRGVLHRLDHLLRQPAPQHL